MSATDHATGTAAAGDVALAYETFGDPADPAVLLIMGLGGQLISWPVAFCETLVEHGFFVIRFDNRDIGLSTHLSGHAAPDIMAIVSGSVAPPYTLADMAQDSVFLLDALGIERAHVVGASMGGMIAQTMAIEHSPRVRSLTSIMSTSGDRSVGAPTEAAIGALMSPPGATRAASQARAVAVRQVIGSPGFPFDEAAWAEHAGIGWDRAQDPAGVARQLAAVVAGADRTEGLRTLTLPALVIHGAEDPLIDVSGGRAVAEAIPGCELLVIDGMGHDLPLELMAQWADAITAVARCADAG